MVEKLVLTGLGDLTGTGKELENEIHGKARGNILDGGRNANLHFGGAGDDTYIIDNLGDVADETSESVDAGGNDTIKSSVFSETFFSQAGQHAYIENFTYTGKLAWTFTGDALNNRITASVAGDTLHGGKGADKFHGGVGNDTFVIDNKADQVFEASEGEEADSHDLVRSSISIDLNAAKLNADKSVAFEYYTGVEDVMLTGKAALKATGRDNENNSRTGNDGNNILDAKSGNDTLYGGNGKDTLIGGTGDDFADGGE